MPNLEIIRTLYRGALLASVVVVSSLNAAAFIGGVFRSEFDAIANFAPGLLALGFTLWLLARIAASPRLAIVALTIATLPPAIVIGVDGVGAIRWPAGKHAADLKVMTFNIWSQNEDVSAVQELIRNERPDVLLLQETSTKRHFFFIAELAKIYPTRIANHRRNCATHVFSIYPLIEKIENKDCDFVAARVALPAELGGGDLMIASAHIARGDESQPTFIKARMAEWAEGSAIVGGDFNRTPWSWALREFDGVSGFDRRTHALPTWPTRLWETENKVSIPFAVLPIDHVYATDDWRTVDVRRAEVTGSDHYPVIIELVRTQ
jgi:vancomycin resistance protein VanJ